MRACRGDHKTKPSERFRVTEVEKPARGGPSYITPRKVTQIFTPHYKEAIAEKVILPSEAPGSFNFFGGVVGTRRTIYASCLMNKSWIRLIEPPDVARANGKQKTNSGAITAATRKSTASAPPRLCCTKWVPPGTLDLGPTQPEDGESVKRLQEAALQVVARDYQLL